LCSKFYCSIVYSSLRLYVFSIVYSSCISKYVVVVDAV
jgi:hypothetical protein